MSGSKKMVKTMLGDYAEKEISNILVSNDTVHRCVLEMFNDTEENGCSNKLQNSYFALQDIANKVQLLAFICFIDRDKIVNQFLYCKEFLTTTTNKM